MKKTILKGLVLTLLMATFALQGCAGDKKNAGENSDNNSSQESSITIGISQDIEDTLDPHNIYAAGTKEIFFNIYEGLVKYDENGDLNPAVASDYSISNDGLVYTFTLREGILFHDMQPVTTEDVVYSINRCAGADGKEPLVPAFSNIKSISADDKTVVIELEKADSDFLAYMTTAIIPKNNTTPESNAIGTGPYTYVSRNPGVSVTLKKFDEYWGEKANIDNVNLKVCTDADTVPMELIGGSIDMYMRLTSDQVAQLQGKDFDIEEGTMNLVQALYLNNKVEPFDNPDVRKALCYAINAEEIMQYVSDGKGTKIGTSMFPAFSKYYDESICNNYSYNIEKAKELLEKAGYKDGFSFTITVPSNYQQHVDTATVIVEQLKAINVNAEINLVDWDTWLSEVYSNRNYETTVVGVDASVLTARALIERFTSEAGNNFINYKNEKFDAKFNEAITTYDDDKQTSLYKECLAILNEDAANVYIQDLPVYVALNNKFAGYKFYPLYVQDFASLYVK